MRRKQNLIIVVAKPHPAPRVHRVLFEHNTPFRSKTQRNRVLYQRNIKHRNQVDL